MADEPAERPPLAARIEQGFGTEATSSPSQPCPNAATVGEPGFWEGAIPIWGSGKAAINDFQTGHWGWGLFNSAMAVSDVFLVKALVVGAGKLVAKGVAKAVVKETAEVAEQQVVKEAAEQVPKAGKYSRPSNFRQGVRDEAWEATKSKDGLVRDPQTGRVMDKAEAWDMGHKPGYEFRKHAESAQERNISRKDFLNEHNNPEHYRPELPSSNRNHLGEDMTSGYKGP